MCGSPKLIAACHVLLRLFLPRHPPCALSSLTIELTRTQNLQPRSFPPLAADLTPPSRTRLARLSNAPSKLLFDSYFQFRISAEDTVSLPLELISQLQPSQGQHLVLLLRHSIMHEINSIQRNTISPQLLLSLVVIYPICSVVKHPFFIPASRNAALGRMSKVSAQGSYL